METQEYVEIRIKGKKGEAHLSPENFDIEEIRTLLDSFEPIIFSGSARKRRPVVTYEQTTGSLFARFKTKAQYVLGFAALLVPIRQNPGLDILELGSARGIQKLQDFASSRGYSLDIGTSVSSERLHISRETSYRLSEDTLVDAEFYLYGEVETVGGKTTSSLHVDTAQYGLLTVRIPRQKITELKENLVYHTIGIRARGKQRIRDFEVDKQSLVFVDFLHYTPKPDRAYLDSLIQKASSSWANVSDPDAWLHSLRGGELGG